MSRSHASDVPSDSIRCVARTTVDLDAGVLRALKRRSAKEGKPMGVLASELLASALAEPADAEPAGFEWIARDLGQPLVNIDDKDALWAALDGR
jgi:hypothetical protein